MSLVKAAVRRIALGALPALLLVVLFVPMPVRAQGFVPAPSPAVALETCIGEERYQLNAGSDSVVLDEVDRAGVQSALLERYPAFGRDGSAISAIVLWRKPETGWVYLALKTHPDKPGKVCSAASFSAGVFGFSAELQRKYFFGTRS